MHIASDACQSVSYLPPKVLEETLEATNSGLSQSEYVEPYTDQVNSQPECNEEMLQKVEPDERLVMIHGSPLLSTPDTNIQCSTESMFEKDPVHHESLCSNPFLSL